MRKSMFTEEQSIGFLKLANAGLAVAKICNKGGFSGATPLQVAVQDQWHGGVGRAPPAGAGG